ncbi:hypothetical protein [Salinimicrobium sp. TH3]|uniref:hypothetical protein n=1 Tax=Salinimicrobium sp. TH3 TaxID=2997342 RepID=UPI002275A46C|nr:hypothetical protein [Salinimicrobium sp. TH3]MCY2687611.1 hypothetical protein [Salinimicrobium sp. TH3]
MKQFSFQEKMLAENEDYSLSCNPSGTILYQEHFRVHDLTKPELKQILNTISSGSFKAYLIKVNNGNIFPPEDLAWIEKFNLLRLFKAGISKVAYVSPKNLFSSLEMEKEIKPGKIFRIRIFKRTKDAAQWLEQSLQKEVFYPEG